MKITVYFMISMLILSMFLFGCSKDVDVESGLDDEMSGASTNVNVEVEASEDTVEDVVVDQDVSESGDNSDEIVTVDDEGTEDSDDEISVENNDEEESGDVIEDEGVVSVSADEPYIVNILEGVYFDPKEPRPKVGQEVVFVNKPVEDKKDKFWTIVGDSQDFFSSEVMGPHDQYSHVYEAVGEYTVKISPGGAGKIYVEG
ncbi:MAG: hypothetical protein U9R08_06060 [Nanoarchaeota archaeon]|nr:hypothetical protein [Nanoarchaeota archaeon]